MVDPHRETGPSSPRATHCRTGSSAQRGMRRTGDRARGLASLPAARPSGGPLSPTTLTVVPPTHRRPRSVGVALSSPCCFQPSCGTRDGNGKVNDAVVLIQRDPASSAVHDRAVGDVIRTAANPHQRRRPVAWRQAPAASVPGSAVGGRAPSSSSAAVLTNPSAHRAVPSRQGSTFSASSQPVLAVRVDRYRSAGTFAPSSNVRVPAGGGMD
jgi:hypothetical protein